MRGGSSPIEPNRSRSFQFHRCLRFQGQRRSQSSVTRRGLAVTASSATPADVRPARVPRIQRASEHASSHLELLRRRMRLQHDVI